MIYKLYSRYCQLLQFHCNDQWKDFARGYKLLFKGLICLIQNIYRVNEQKCSVACMTQTHIHTHKHTHTHTRAHTRAHTHTHTHTHTHKEVFYRNSIDTSWDIEFALKFYTGSNYIPKWLQDMKAIQSKNYRELTEQISALLWQKEASDIPSKSELLMFSYPSVFFFQAKSYA